MSIRAITRALPSLALVWVSTAVAFGQGVPLEAGSHVRLKGTSTLHDWACEAGGMDARLLAPDAIVQIQLQPEDQGIGELTLAIASLECGDNRMERQMREVLRAGEFPVIHYLLTGYRRTPERGELSIEATGAITVAGVTRPLVVQVEGHVDEDGVLRAAGEASFRMTDFGLKPPTAFFGLLKAGNVVAVQFDLRTRMADLRNVPRYQPSAP